MIGSTLLSTGLGLLNSNSQKKQAKATLAANTDIANKTLEAQKAQFGKVETAAQPYLGLGAQATGNLMDPAKAFEASPGYNFRVAQGTQGVLGSTALNGLLRSGSAVKALNNYVQGQASDEYGKWTSQQQGNAQIGTSGLGSLATAAGGTANAYGANAANITNANNTAAADIHSATNAGYNALGQGLGGLASNPLLNSMLKKFTTTPSVQAGGSSYIMPATGGARA